MTETEQRYELKSIIDNIKEYYKNGTYSESKTHQLEVILYKLNNIDTILENIDQDILGTTISSDYNNCKTYTTNIIKNNDSSLTYLNNTLDTMFSKIYEYVDFKMLLGNRSEIKKYIREYKYNISRQSEILENEVNDIKDLIRERKDEINNENSELNKSLNTFKEELNTINEQKDKLKQKINEMLETEKEGLKIQLDDETKKLNEQYIKIIEEYNQKFETLSTSYKNSFDSLLTQLKEKEKQISELVGIVGTKSKIGEYKKNADSSRIERIIWQSTTIILFLIAFGIMIYVTLTSKNYNNFTIFKYIVSAILMGAAAYTSKQASNARKDEVYYRKQQLELASIDVYLESLKPESREEIKKNLSDKLFGQAKNTYTNKYDEGKGFSIDDLVRVIEAIKKN